MVYFDLFWFWFLNQNKCQAGCTYFGFRIYFGLRTYFGYFLDLILVFVALWTCQDETPDVIGSAVFLYVRRSDIFRWFLLGLVERPSLLLGWPAHFYPVFKVCLAKGYASFVVEIGRPFFG